jgi:Uma2 family endonuclease
VLAGVPGNILYRCRPDVAFVPQQNVRKTQGYIFGVPALAVEIISPREEAAAIRGKLEAYLRYGVRQVWHIYPSLQTLIIYLPDGTARTCKADETVTGGDVLPGFSLKLSELFED